MQKPVLAIMAGLCLAGFTSQAAAIEYNLDYTGPVNQQITLDAGSYEITPLGTVDGGQYDAVNYWSNVSGCDGNGENCSQGWVWSFSLQDAVNAVVASYSSGIYSNRLAALGEAKAFGPFQFDLASSQTLHFQFDDTNYSDNIDGVSFDLSLAPLVTSVPAPGTLALFGIGLAGAGLLRRRRKAG